LRKKVGERDRQWLRPSGVAKRFTRRASTLLDDETYLRATDVAFAQWNSLFARYAIRRSGPAPKRVGVFDLYPPAFSAAVSQAIKRRRFSSASARATLAPGEMIDPSLAKPKEAWTELCLGLCTEWWPEENFPRYATWPVGWHPALPFVAGGILWDPRRPQSRGHLAEWVAQHVNTPEHAPAVDPTTDVVRLTPGMTSADWRALEPLILDRVGRAEEELLMGRAGTLRANGMSQRAIASELGVSRDRIQRLMRVGPSAAPTSAGQRAFDALFLNPAGEAEDDSGGSR
jgi:hypothetical protein